MRMFQYLIATSVLVSSFAFSLNDDDTTFDAPTLAVDTLPKILDSDQAPLGFSELPVCPDDNPMSNEKVALGRKLFFDPILSKDNSVSCASCHRPENGFANSEKLAIGIGGKIGTRNVPTIFNRGYGEHFTWDGKSKTLEEQVLTPITDPNEMGDSVEAVLNDLKKNKEYVSLFNEVFGDGQPATPKLVTEENLARAIAAFERVLVYGDTKVDRFRASEYTALSREARQGMWIFESRGGCWKCHGGENFSDEDFHNTGVGFGDAERDVGRFGQTNNESDRFKFKTPSLRGIDLTAPYMHDGSQSTLKDVVDFYNKGGSVDDPNLDVEIKPLDLTDEEVGFLVEFLKALSQ